MFKLVRQLRESLRRRGFVGTAAFGQRELIRRYRLHRSFDRIHGTDTAGQTPLGDLSIASENRHHGIHYQPMPAKLFPKVIKRLPVRPEGYVFIDFGSGKGRALLLASSYPFKRVIGVEFASALHATALKNIARYRSAAQRCFRIEAICMDAADYEIPPEPAIYYFFNPFDDVIMRTVLTNIKMSLESSPRDAFFIYCNPIHAHLFDELGIKKDKIILFDPGWGD